MAKYTVDIYLPRAQFGPSSIQLSELDHDVLGLDGSEDTDYVAERVVEFIRDGIEVTKHGATYDIAVYVKATYSFTFEDEEGEYEDEAAVEQAVSVGDIDYTDFVSLDCPDDVEVYEVGASEA